MTIWRLRKAKWEAEKQEEKLRRKRKLAKIRKHSEEIQLEILRQLELNTSQ